MYVRVCVYVCVYVCMHACMHVYVYACMCVCMYACICICMYVCMHVFMSVFVYMCMYVCTYVCMYLLILSEPISFRDSLHCGVTPRFYLTYYLTVQHSFSSPCFPSPCFPSSASLPLSLSPSLPRPFRSRHLNHCHCSWMPHLSLSLSPPSLSQ
jgi:hypothetical protein